MVLIGIPRGEGSGETGTEMAGEGKREELEEVARDWAAGLPTAELTWLTMLLAAFGIPQSSSPILYCDNLSALSLATNPVFHSRSKHIEIDCHFIRDKVAAKRIQLKYVPTEAQVADIFTKPLSASRFHTLSAKLMVFPSPICLRGTEENTAQDLKTQAAQDLKT